MDFRSYRSGMFKNALIINGAPRFNGNSDILVNEIIETSRNNGVGVKLVELRTKRIGNCIGCYKCMRESTCYYDDDMTQIRSDINNAELMILASPLYWYGVTGLMKTFIDRLFFYYHPRNKEMISGKKALIITPMYQRDVEYEANLLIQFYHRTMNMLEVAIVDMIFLSGLSKQGDVLDKHEYLEEAHWIGENLTKLA